MSEFNTHGGLFSPYGYSKITEGGTHEQNPNGGVQFGVDKEGVPNLLEEGESVYKDYVFSNRIKLTAKAAKDNNIPDKYAGMKYSDIADVFVDEAVERPNDPISNNGVKAMLNRLIAAQEQQKMEQEQRDIERELENLSPEELEQLSTMLEQQQPVEEQPMPVEQMQPEMAMEQQAPMFAEGGSVDDDVPPGPDEVYAVRDNTRTPFVEGVGFIPEQDLSRIESVEDAAARKFAENHEPVYNDDGTIAFYKPSGGMGSLDLLGGPATSAGLLNSVLSGKGIKTTAKVKTMLKKATGKISSKLNNKLSNLSEEAGKTATSLGKKAQSTKASIARAKEDLADISNTVSTTKKGIEQAVSAASENYGFAKEAFEKRATKLAEDLGPQRVEKLKAQANMVGLPISYGVQKALQGATTGISKGANSLSKVKVPKWVWPVGIGATAAGGVAIGSALSKEEYEDANDSFLKGINSKAMGGNMYPDGTPNLNRKNGYSYYTNPDGTVGYVYYPTVEGSTQQSTVAPTVKANTLLQATPAFGVQAHYTRKPLGVWSQNTPGMWANNILTGYVNGDSGTTASSGAGTRTSGRRAGSRTGFVATVPTLDIPEIDESLYKVDLQDNNPLNNPVYATALANVDKPVLNEKQRKTLEYTGNSSTPSNYPLYNTGLRYAGAVGSALGALYNSAKKPTQFHLPDIDVVVPTGSMRQQYEKYQAIDPALYQNALTAQVNAQRRAMMNSGLGPSVTPAITALDSNATGAVGSAVINGIADANNRRNAVVAANNRFDAQKAAFDYQVMAARAQAINQARMLRGKYNLLTQQLNDAATTEQYQAISKELDAVKQALSAIGRENFVLNQVNTNEALRYGVNPGGISYYKTLLKNYGE